MRFQDTFFKCVLNRKIIIASCSRCFAKLLLYLLNNFIPAIACIHSNHFARILLMSGILLHIWTSLHDVLMIRDLHASLGSIA
jgi:hypothetical protein